MFEHVSLNVDIQCCKQYFSGFLLALRFSNMGRMLNERRCLEHCLLQILPTGKQRQHIQISLAFLLYGLTKWITVLLAWCDIVAKMPGRRTGWKAEISSGLSHTFPLADSPDPARPQHVSTLYMVGMRSDGTCWLALAMSDTDTYTHA